MVNWQVGLRADGADPAIGLDAQEPVGYRRTTDGTEGSGRQDIGWLRLQLEDPLPASPCAGGGDGFPVCGETEVVR